MSGFCRRIVVLEHKHYNKSALEHAQTHTRKADGPTFRSSDLFSIFAVSQGKFSSKSDVWAFAVTLWEMMTFSRERPFSDLSDEKIIDNCSHFFKQDGLEAYLPQPSACTREIYDLMCECWNRDEILRPSFREVHMFLQRKNMGYDPKEDSAAMRNTLPEAAMV